MEWLFAITAVLAVLLCACVIFDKIVFTKKLNKIEIGMTGKEIQRTANIKLKIIRIESGVYYAKISSTLSLFHYQLTFKNGKLLQKHRI